MRLMHSLLVVVFGSIIACTYSETYSQTATLIKDFINVHNLNTILMVTCGRNQHNVESIETLFSLQHQGIWLNVWDISNEDLIPDFDYDKFFIRLSNAHCVVMDLDCNTTDAFMRQMSNRILFHYERNWLIFSSNFNDSLDILSQQNINVDAEISLVVPVAAAENDIHSHDIYEVYNPSSKHGGRLNVTRSGDWNNFSGLRLSHKRTKIERRRNLQGITFASVITLRNVPNGMTYLEHLRSNDFGYLNSVSRIGYHLFALIMEMHNFEININVTDEYAALDPSGNWLGSIEMVIRREVDFCLTPLRWENDRYGLVEHTTNAYYAQILFVFRHPKSIPSNIFFMPFETTTVYGIVGLVLLSACIVRNIFSVENHQKVRNSIKQKWVNEDSCSNSTQNCE